MNTGTTYPKVSVTGKYLFPLMAVSVVVYFVSTASAFLLIALVALLSFSALFFHRFKTAIFVVLLLRASLDAVNQFALGGYSTLGAEQMLDFNIGGTAQRFNFFSVFSVLFITLYLARQVFNRVGLKQIQGGLWAYVGFLGVALFSGVVFGADRFLFLVDWMKYVSSGLLLLSVIEITTDEESLWQTISVVVISAVVPVAVGLFQAITGIGVLETTKYNFGILETTYRSIIGTFEGAHQYAFYLATLLPLTIFLLQQPRVKARFFVAVLPVLMAVCIYFTYIKSVLGVLVMEALTFIALRRSYVFLAVFLVGATFLFMNDPTLQGRIVEDLASAQVGDERSLFSGRVNIWLTILESYREQPLLAQLFGVGLRSTVFVVGGKTGWLLGPHSEVIHFLYETGIVGLLLFAWFYASLIRKTVVLKRRGSTEFFRGLGFWMLVMLVGVLPHLVGDNPFTGLGSVWYFFALAGIVEGAYRLEKFESA